MKLSLVRVCAVVLATAMLSPASPSLAQQTAAPPAAVQPPAAPPALAPVAQPAPAPEVAAASSSSRSLKAEPASLRELSPWSMFLSADVLVKAVMIGLAFASLMTWTIFIAKMIELGVARRKLKTALNKI